MKEGHPRKPTMFKLYQNSKEPDKPTQLKRTRRSRSFLYFLSPQTFPFCHSPSTARRFSCRYKWPLGSGSPATKPHAFPGTACPGHVATPRHLSQLSILKKREIFPLSPCNPMTCNASLPTAASLSKTRFRSRTEYSKHRMSREACAERLHNLMTVKDSGQHSILVVDGTSFTCIRDFQRSVVGAPLVNTFANCFVQITTPSRHGGFVTRVSNWDCDLVQSYDRPLRCSRKCKVWSGMHSLECCLERDQSYHKKNDPLSERESRLPLGGGRFTSASGCEHVSKTPFHNCNAGIPSILKPASTETTADVCTAVRHGCLLLAHPGKWNKCLLCKDT